MPAYSCPKCGTVSRSAAPIEELINPRCPHCQFDFRDTAKFAERHAAELLAGPKLYRFIYRVLFDGAKREECIARTAESRPYVIGQHYPDELRRGFTVIGLVSEKEVTA